MNESNDMFEYVDKFMSEAGAVVIADEFEMPGGMGATPFYTPCGEQSAATTPRAAATASPCATSCSRRS